MTWLGAWRNQYGSVVEITSETNGRIEGSFKTALEASRIYGQTVPIQGVCRGDLISFACGGTSPQGDMVVSYTGILRNGRLETLWHMVSGERITAKAEGEPGEKKQVESWEAFVTSLDTFERAS